MTSCFNALCISRHEETFVTNQSWYNWPNFVLATSYTEMENSLWGPFNKKSDWRRKTCFYFSATVFRHKTNFIHFLVLEVISSSKAVSVSVFNWAPQRESIWGSGGYLHTFLNSALDGGEQPALRLWLLSTRKWHPFPIEYEVVRAHIRSEDFEKQKILFSFRKSNPNRAKLKQPFPFRSYISLLYLALRNWNKFIFLLRIRPCSQ